MILHLLRHSEFADIAKLCTPSLFSVLSASALASSVKALMASRDATHHAAVCARHRALHEGDGVTITGALSSRPGRLDPAARVDAGQRILRLYFRMLLGADDALLDLRAGSFRFADRALEWKPAALSVRWKPGFSGGLRATYEGFYGGDDVLFREGLAALSLTHAEALFRSHFGADPSAVTFRTKEFTHTFGLVFEACARARVTLDGDFVPFGFLLGALYQSLEALETPLDVRAAFEAVQSR